MSAGDPEDDQLLRHIAARAPNNEVAGRTGHESWDRVGGDSNEVEDGIGTDVRRGDLVRRGCATWLLLWETRPVLTDRVLLSCLARYWGLRNVRLTAHDGGMGSRTWFVDLDDRRWVAKAVAPRDGSQFAGGLAIATRL